MFSLIMGGNLIIRETLYRLGDINRTSSLFLLVVLTFERRKMNNWSTEKEFCYEKNYFVVFFGFYRTLLR